MTNLSNGVRIHYLPKTIDGEEQYIYLAPTEEEEANLYSEPDPWFDKHRAYLQDQNFINQIIEKFKISENEIINHSDYTSFNDLNKSKKFDRSIKQIVFEICKVKQYLSVIETFKGKRDVKNSNDKAIKTIKNLLLTPAINYKFNENLINKLDSQNLEDDPLERQLKSSEIIKCFENYLDVLQETVNNFQEADLSYQARVSKIANEKKRLALNLAMILYRDLSIKPVNTHDDAIPSLLDELYMFCSKESGLYTHPQPRSEAVTEAVKKINSKNFG